MYNPEAFREERPDVLRSLIRNHPLATLVTYGERGIQTNLLPFALVEEGSRGILKAHLAKANPQLEDLRAGAEAVVVFQGAEAYITPSWYASKQEHGKVVPTWNYVVVEARGIPHVIEDAGWLRDQIDLLTAAQEAGRAKPWEVSDAPEGYIAPLLKAIAGVEIPIGHWEGKWKMSQNRSEADQSGVRTGLATESACPEMAAMIGRPTP
jgi:transcriptional regulator